jgi:hypothetical protein
MSRLSDQIAGLEKKLGDVAAYHADVYAVMAPFMARFYSEILPIHEQIVKVQRAIVDTRLLAGDKSVQDQTEARTALSILLEPQGESVSEQYERVWGEQSKVKTKPIPLPEPPSPELLALYTRVVARIHLGLDDAAGHELEKRRLAQKKTDHALVRRDKIALAAMVDMYYGAEPGSLPMVVDQQAVETMRSRRFALDEAIAAVESRLFDLQHGDVARLRSQAEIA